MKRTLAILLIMMTLIFSVPVYAVTETPSLNAKSAILIDANTGNVLFEKDANTKCYPASTTKIMTALVTLEEVKKGNISLEQPIKYTETASKTIDAESSVIGLKVGEEMQLKDLLDGLLIASGNDAASIIAEYIGSGNPQKFIDMMNARAKALGLKNTHFVNPHGLHNANHYTTASDMAKIAREAMKYEDFRNIVDIAHIYLPETNMSDRRYFINTNNLVSRFRFADYFYDKATGIKTGTTDQAGYCLVSSAKDGDKSVIAVAFKADGTPEVHKDSKNLLEYGLTAFAQKKLASAGDICGEVKVKHASGKEHLMLAVRANLLVMVDKKLDTSKIESSVSAPKFVKAPVKTGQKIGTVTYTYNGKELATADLVSEVDIKRSMFWFIPAFFEWLWAFRFVKIIVFGIIAIVLLIIILFIIGFYRAIKKSKSKQRRRHDYHPPQY